MTDIDPHAAPPPLKLFRVFMRMGVWRVTKDGAHYGDYSARMVAVEQAEAAIADVVRRGGRAELSMHAPGAQSA
jgi:hypothetical protein